MTDDFISSLENQSASTGELAEARLLVAGLAVRVEADKKAAFAPDVIAALRLLKEQARGEYEEAKELLKGCGVSIAAVSQEINKGAKLRAVEVGERVRRTACDFADLRGMPELIRGLVVPSDYRIIADGAGGYELVKTGFMEQETVSHCAPFISGRTRDIDGDSEGLRLSWSRGNDFEHRVVNRGQLSDARSMVDLSEIGYAVNSNNAKLQVDYFAKAEAENLLSLPVVSTTRHLAWQGRKKDRGFLVGRELISADGEFTKTETDLNSLDWPENSILFRSSSPGDQQIIDGFQRQGSFGEWVNTIQLASKFPRVMIALYASLTAPMLPIFDCPNFILDICSRTSQGKTTTQRIAGSAWGDPDERKPASAVQTWDQTKVSVERRLAILASLPLILDDTKRIKDIRQIPEILYTVASGQGRGRGSIHGIQTVLTWSTILISSGEQKLTSFSNDGGTKMRVLEIEGMPFGKQDVGTAKLVESINFAVCQNFGHAGPEFVRWVVQNRAKWPEWKAAFKAKAEAYTKAATNEKASRLALYAAAIAQTAELVHEALGLPWKYSDPLETLWAEISGEADDPLGAVRALRYVLSWAYANENRFLGREMDIRNAPSGGWLGRWNRGDDEPMAIFPHFVEDILRAQKFHPEAIFGEWRERGWLDIPEKEKGFTKSIWISASNKTARLLTFKPEAINFDL